MIIVDDFSKDECPFPLFPCSKDDQFRCWTYATLSHKQTQKTREKVQVISRSRSSPDFVKAIKTNFSCRVWISKSFQEAVVHFDSFLKHQFFMISRWKVLLFASMKKRSEQCLKTNENVSYSFTFLWVDFSAKIEYNHNYSPLLLDFFRDT